MDEIINYGTNTPENFNPNVVRSMLGNINNSGSQSGVGSGSFIFELTPNFEEPGSMPNSYYATANKLIQELYQAITEGKTITVKFQNQYYTPNIYYTNYYTDEEFGDNAYEVDFSIKKGFYDNQYNLKYTTINFFTFGYESAVAQEEAPDSIQFQEELTPIGMVSLIHLNTYVLKADDWPLDAPNDVQNISIGIDSNTGYTYLFNYMASAFYSIDEDGHLNKIERTNDQRDENGFYSIEKTTYQLQITNN